MTAFRNFIIVSILLWCNSLHGQNSFNGSSSAPDYKINLRRQLFHDNINREQQSLLDGDGRKDKELTVSPNEEVNLMLTDVLTRSVDGFQYRIETDSVLDHRLKVNYLSGMASMLKYVRQNRKNKKINILHLPVILSSYEKAIALDTSGQSIVPLISSLSYDVAAAVMASETFRDNRGYKEASDLVILKYIQKHPQETFLTLMEHPDLVFADSLIKAASRRYPNDLYNFAPANNRLGYRIRKIQDDNFIRTIVKMSQSKQGDQHKGQQYFPFLDNIVKGKMTFEQIDAAENDSIQYFRLLVNTQMDYVNRAQMGDTAIGYKDLIRRLEMKAKDVFVNTINALHNEPDAVRFRCLQNLTAYELYYIAVLTDGLIYTSSYTKGVYPLMMKKIGNRGDSLLVALHFDHYRRFISQAAAYNTLSNFLSTFPSHEYASDLMRAFVSGLEKTEGLEDGVDVADSYASIVETNPKLAADVLSLVQENYQQNLQQNNTKGIVIYNILNKLFLSAEKDSKIDLTSELGIPPVYNVPFKALADGQDRVVMQVFFYGDKDGKTFFPGFVSQFANNNWSIDRSNPQWVTIKSAKGKSVFIYANKPLPEETEADDKAQQALGEYLEKNNFTPTITIHRGHSYYANTTIGYMAPTSRIVFMGSCGGFNLIDSILRKSSDAHIIASKQIGKGSINEPFFQLLADKVRNGQDVDWIPFWQEFKGRIRVEGFEDYIPPYKNLGAIFIKAYRRAMNEEEEE